MHESLRLYDASLAILEQELQALDGGDEELQTDLCEKRVQIMGEAWVKRAGCPVTLLLERLNAIHEAQETLAAKTRGQTETLRLELRNSRKESTRLNGYGKVLGNRQDMRIVRKEG